MKWWSRLVGNVLLVLSIIILFILIPNSYTWLVSNLIIITCILLHDLYWKIRLLETYTLKNYITFLIKTILIINFFMALIYISGYFGILGLIILTLLLAAWRLYKGWKLFDSYTSWAAKRLWRKTKKNFDFKKVLK